MIMRPIVVLTLCVALTFQMACGQGWFEFNNPGAPTHIGTADGPLAGPGIWAHMLAGPTADSLTPVGMSAEHWGRGRVSGSIVQVPGIPEYSIAMVQMVVWDGQIWGTSLAGVPLNQLGRTDTVAVMLDTPPPGLVNRPYFTQSAIVPLIPEPSLSSLGALAGALLVGLRSRWRWRAAARARMTAPLQFARIRTAATS